MKLHRQIIEQYSGEEIANMRHIAGGMNGQVYRVDLIGGASLIVKHAQHERGKLDIEGRMLHYLRQHSALPVPEVIHSEASLLIMAYIDNNGSIGQQAQIEAAQHLAALHDVSSDHYGLTFDTLIGSLHQPNTQDTSWLDFFREQRLLYIARVAYEAGELPSRLRRRIEQFAAQLDDFLFEPEKPSLIHGDMWGGNILTRDGHLAGFIDPAIYYAHDEIELAFSTLFNTFGDAFFAEYNNLRPIEPDFFEERRDIYNLYPLLVHVRLFGGGYVRQVERILTRFDA